MSLGDKIVLDSKIVIALNQFKADYAWDKSLINPDHISPQAQAPYSIQEHSATYLEDFIRSQQATAQQDQ